MVKKYSKNVFKKIYARNSNAIFETRSFVFFFLGRKTTVGLFETHKKL